MRTSLQIVTNILLGLDASIVNLVEYIPQTKYETQPRVLPTSMAKLPFEYAAKLAAIKHTDAEVGISSQFVDIYGKTKHLVFADMANHLKWTPQPKDILVSSSAEGQHVYRHEYRESIAAVGAQLLNTYGSFLDLGWVAAGLGKGYNVLRLSANTMRFEKHGEPHE